jgi:hypothetical protein
MPLALGIVPEEHRAAVLQRVIDDIHAHQDHVTTGEVGYPYMVRLLQEEGRGDVLLAMLLRRDAPSYGSQIEKGATTLTEAWDANPRNVRITSCWAVRRSGSLTGNLFNYPVYGGSGTNRLD